MISNITAPLAMGLNSDYYTIREANGFSSAGVSVSKYNRPGYHGIKIPRAYWRERIMSLIIGIRASDSATYEEKRRDLQEAFDCPRNGLTWLKFTTTGGLALQIQVQLNSGIQAPLQAGEVTIGTARIELIAEDPIFYSQTENEEDITFASGSGTINNGGNAPVFPSLKIHGNVENPSVENVGLGMTISFTTTITAGSYYDIDTLDEIVEDETNTSQYSNINEDDFFYLKKGDNEITLDGTPGASGYKKVTFTFRDGYLGI